MTRFKLRGPDFPKVHLLYLFFTINCFTFSLFAWLLTFRLEAGLLGDTLADAHIAFTAVGITLFTMITSPLVYWPYKYGAQLPPRYRRNFVFLGIMLLWILNTFPLWIMEFYVGWQFGIFHVIQGISLVLLTMHAFFGFLATWIGYTWKMSKILQVQFGTPMNTVYKDRAAGGHNAITRNGGFPLSAASERAQRRLPPPVI